MRLIDLTLSKNPFFGLLFACLRACAARGFPSFTSTNSCQLLSSKVTEKHGITSRLTELIMASEKQRDAKLNEIMKKMSTDGGGAGAGAGPAGAH